MVFIADGNHKFQHTTRIHTRNRIVAWKYLHLQTVQSFLERFRICVGLPGEPEKGSHF